MTRSMFMISKPKRNVIKDFFHCIWVKNQLKLNQRKCETGKSIDNTAEFWGSIIGKEIFAQNRGFIIGKVAKIMISEG